MAKPIEYQLEVYEPGSRDDVWVVFTASSPFVPLPPGTVLHPVNWRNSQSPMKALQVVAAQHIIWENATLIKQKIMRYTKEIDNR